jgi:hypothetical protein
MCVTFARDIVELMKTWMRIVLDGIVRGRALLAGLWAFTEVWDASAPGPHDRHRRRPCRPWTGGVGVARAAGEGIGDAHQLEQMIGRDFARWAQRAFRRSPLIIPIVIDA